MFNIVTETTYRVLNDRRAQLLREVASKTGIAKTVEAACALMLEAFKFDPFDIPLALLYLIDPEGKARLCNSHVGNSNAASDHISPAVIDLTAADDSNGWKIAIAARTAQPQEVTDLVTRFGALPGSPWAEPPQEAMVLPIAAPGHGKMSGVLVAVASPRRRLDEQYRDFFTQVAGQVAMAIANAQTYEEERKRAEALAEIDRAKTTFFSNVSHEFRTPLTLMLSPLEELTTALHERLQPNEREQLQLVQRNGLRLQKLVNTLLDFSRIEAGRVQATFEPIDLAAFTAELASVFRSTIERAGLRLIVECPPLPEAVFVDREMWEKVVFNLLSNAFKFTFTGEIAVGLQWQTDRVALLVRDTGIGIPAAELPHLFERFHRVKGAQGRSFEGSGIGLSLVQELVKLHGGTIAVTSVEGEGTCFTVSIPTGTAHLPPERISATRMASTALAASAYLEEALRWLPAENVPPPGSSAEFNPEPLVQSSPLQLSNAPTARILLADDNADMRDYVQRLLSRQYEVEAVADGVAALSAARQQIPDLVLTDVMMPNLDGFGLLQAMRSDPETRDVPIILLSARAGEESRIEGLAAGADDYLIKPFSARELLARIEATLKLSQLRQAALQREQALREASETAQQQAEAAFRRLDQLLDQMSDAFVTLDRDWRIIYQNAASERINNKPRSEVLGKTLWEEWPAAVNSIADQQYRRAIAEQVSVHFEQHYYEPPDHDVWLEVHAYPFEDGLGIFYRDISDRKQAELEREQLLSKEQAAREAAQAANRIKDEFLAVLSHELRSPLNPILGWAKLLRTGRLDSARTAQALATIERNAELQSELIEDLLDVSRILQGKLSLNVSSIHLASTIQSAIETVQLAAEAKSIQIETHLAPEVGQVLGDSTRLQQVIWNLLSNAVKFTPPGGRVTVRLEQVDHQAQITVSDNGKGIPADFLPHVFDYFRQEDGATTRKFGGLGLGLAIVRHLVELHGGTVTAQSKGENQGAVFTVQLPLTSKAFSDQSEPSHHRVTTETPLSDLQILLVDDEADTREFEAFVLQQSGANVTAVASGFDALQALDRCIPDVLVSDIGMAEMDGYMLIRQIRSRPANQGGTTPAIALTAYARDSDRQKAFEAGFQAYITKPIEPQALVKAVLQRISD